MTTIADMPSSLTQSQQAYIKDVQDYRGYYDKRAVTAKRNYLMIKALTVLGGALVPAVLVLPVQNATFVATFLSIMVVALLAIEEIFHYGLLWRNFRTNEQFLRQQLLYFIHRSGPYQGEDAEAAFKNLLLRVEEAIQRENISTLDVALSG